MKKKIGILILVIFIGIQFIQMDKTLPDSEPSHSILIVENAPPEIGLLIETACNDCHSNHTVFPWYSNLAPLSWWMVGHINHGRENLNFSEWQQYDDKRRDHKLEEMTEMLEKNWMPILSYKLMHAEARLSEQERQLIIDWVKEVRTRY